MNNCKLKIEYLKNYKLKEWGELKYARKNDSGFDLRAAIDQPIISYPRALVNDDSGLDLIPTGIKVDIPIGFEIQIRPRSGTLLRGIAIHNPPIDPGYTGEIHALVENINNKAVWVEKGERKCQLVIAPVIRAVFVEVVINNRGDKGFNSTGRK